jgi:hypothetical protein
MLTEDSPANDLHSVTVSSPPGNVCLKVLKIPFNLSSAHFATPFSSQKYELVFHTLPCPSTFFSTF